MIGNVFLRREEMFTMGSLFPRLTSAGIGKTHYAYFRLPRLSDRLAFGTSADGDHFGRHGVCSSRGTRWNAITPRRRGRRFTEYLGLASSFTRASAPHFNGPNPLRPRASRFLAATPAASQCSPQSGAP